jgi:chemotaxis protein CheZ
MANDSEDLQLQPMITLNEARALLEFWEDGCQDEADQLLITIVSRNQNDLFQSLGKMTRDLHDSLVNFEVDPRLHDIANTEIPDATERLRHIITMTDKAANKTMDAVDNCMPLAQDLSSQIAEIQPIWNDLMQNRIAKEDFLTLVHKVDGLILKSKDDATTLCNQLTEILMAQDFQDLTGQMINRVIKLVSEVESKLLILLKTFKDSNIPVADSKDVDVLTPEGPIIDPTRTDVAQSQDDVDDLLASLGF